MAWRKGLRALLRGAAGLGMLSRDVVVVHQYSIASRSSGVLHNLHQQEHILCNNLHRFVRAYVQPSGGLRGLLSSKVFPPQQGSKSSQVLRRFGIPKATSSEFSLVGRSFSIARWTGQQELESMRLGVSNKQGLALGSAIWRRSFSNPSLTDRFKSTVGKIKEAVLPKGKQNGSASSFKTGAADAGSGFWKPVNSAKQTVMEYRGALGLQLEAFWKRNYLVVVGALGVAACLLLWRIMFGIASMFVGLSEGMAKFGFLALAAAMVTLGGVWLRARLTINPDSVYRLAMRRLKSSEPVLEVLGAPLTGTDVRAYVMSGGGLRFKDSKPRLGGRRCFIIFPITGAEREGLVSIEVKKKNGQYDFKLLAVDIPTAGAEHRVYLVGDEAEYRVGGGLISVLRDPIVKAMAAQKEFEERDDKEEEDDLQRGWEEEGDEALSAKESEREAAAQAKPAVEGVEKALVRVEVAEPGQEPVKT